MKKLSWVRTMPREIWALMFVRFVASAGSFVNPFLTMMLTIKLGYGVRAAGIFMSGVSVAGALGLVLGGKLGDGIGRRRTLIALQTASMAVYLACAIMGFTPLMPFLAAFALSLLSGTWPCINAVVADVAPGEHRKTAFSLLYWGNNIGFSMGPLFAGYLFARAPEMLFAGNAIAIGLAAATVFLFVRETSPAAREPGTDPLPRTGESTIAVLRSEPVLAVYAIIAVLSAFVYNQHTFALPLFMKDMFGTIHGPEGFGAAMMTNGLTVVILTVPLTMLTRRVPPLMGIVASSAVYVLGFGAYAFANGLPFILCATAFWTVGEILGATNGNAFVAERAAPTHRARINSLVSVCYLLGNAAAPLAAGFMAERLGSRAIWYPVAAIALVTAIAYFALHLADGRMRAGRGEGESVV